MLRIQTTDDSRACSAGAMNDISLRSSAECILSSNPNYRRYNSALMTPVVQNSCSFIEKYTTMLLCRSTNVDKRTASTTPYDFPV